MKYQNTNASNTGTTHQTINPSMLIPYFLCTHVISARYPEEDFNPMDFYTLELPFVSKLPEITAIAENLFILLDSVYARIQEAELKRLALEMETQQDN